MPSQMRSQIYVFFLALTSGASALATNTKTLGPVMIDGADGTAKISVSEDEARVLAEIEKAKLGRDFLKSYEELESQVDELSQDATRMFLVESSLEGALSSDLKSRIDAIKKSDLVVQPKGVLQVVWNRRDFGQVRAKLDEQRGELRLLMAELDSRVAFHQFFKAAFAQIRGRLEGETHGDISKDVTDRMKLLELTAFDSLGKLEEENVNRNWSWRRVRLLANRRVENIQSDRPNFESIAELFALRYVAITKLVEPVVEKSLLNKVYLKERSLVVALMAVVYGGISAGLISTGNDLLVDGMPSVIRHFGEVFIAMGVGAPIAWLFFGLKFPQRTFFKKYAELQQGKLEKAQQSLIEKSCQILLAKN